MKKEKVKSKSLINMIWGGIGFSVIYWILESVRDVVTFGKGTLIERIFLPDAMSFWMRVLVVCIIILFSIRIQSLKERIDKQGKEYRSFGTVGIIKVGLIFGLFYWVLESFRDTFVFEKGNLIQRLFTPDLMSVWMRLLAIFVLLLFSIYVQSLINEQRKAEEALRREEQELEKKLEERSAEIVKSNRRFKQEIAERNRVEGKLRKINRALRTLSEGNKALVHAVEESNLLNDICNVLVEGGGYDFAWVGFNEGDEKKNIHPVAKAGDDDGYLGKITSDLNNVFRANNPIGKVIQTGKPCTVKNIEKEFKGNSWSRQAVKRGYTSLISLPLMNDDSVLGALTIYTKEADVFDAKEVQLLEELASDLAFGIKVLRTRAARKQAEKKLRESEAKYRTLAENINVGIFRSTVGPEGKFIEVNPAMVRMFGYESKEDLLAANVSDLYQNPRDRAKFNEKMLKYGFIKNEESISKRKDGTTFIASDTTVAGKDEKGNVLYYDGIVEDITERKQAEKNLKRLNRALKTLSEGNKVLVHAVNESDLLEDVCSVLVRVGGYDLAWVGFAEQDGKKSIPPVARAGDNDGYLNAVNFTWNYTSRNHNPIGEAIQTGKPCSLRNIEKEVKGNSCNREAVKRGYTSMISLPLMNDDSVLGALTIYTKEVDVFDAKEVQLLEELASDMTFGIKVLRTRTARKKAEKEKEKMQAQLIQAQKMEAVGILAGGIAHDFNNILTAIQVSTDLAMMEVDQKSTLYGDLKEVHHLTERASDIIRQLLLFGRKHPMEFIPVNLNKTVLDLRKMLRRLIGEDIEVVTELESNLWPIQADRGTMEQVIMNLAVNARDAMPDGGRLILKTANVVIDKAQCKDMPAARPGKFICFSVSDTGIGMDKDTVQHIFEPFFSTKGIGKGTGLGLSVVYGIIKQHKGWIQVTSEPGSGTTFRIYLPAISKRMKGKTKEEVFLKNFSADGKRILIVEDEEKVREFTTSGLSRSGYIVFPAANAEEAVNIFRREKGNFHLVLSDVVLPDKSGIELVEHFLSYKSNLGVLLTSGYTDHKSRWPLIKKRGFQFLEKPYTLGELLQVVQQIVA